MNQPKKPKIKKVAKSFVKKDGTPKRGYRYTENTSGRIPNPAVEPIPDKPAKLKSMRTIASGTTGSGKVRVTEKRRSL